MDNYGKRIDEHTVRFERMLPGPSGENLEPYLTDGAKRGVWFAAGALPAKAGERFELRFKHADLSPNKAPPPDRFADMDKNGFVSHERLVALEPMRRLVHTFGEDNPPATEVEFLLTPEGDKVRLTLTHSKIPDRAYAVNISGGWHSHLSILEDKAAGKTPDAFWDVWRRTEHSYDQRYG